jgi:hypothetical protein
VAVAAVAVAAMARVGDYDQVQSSNQARLKKLFSRELNNINDYANKAETPTMTGNGGVTLAVLQNIKTLLLRLRLMRRRRRRRFHNRWISYGN